MADGNFVLPAPETVSMSGDAARRLIGCGSGDAALVYLYILNSGGRFDIHDAALKTGRTEVQIDAAMNVLARLGLVNRSEAGTPQKAPERADELPQYTTEDIMREKENGPEFELLINEVQRALGKLLSSDDVIKLYGIYDYLGLPFEVILQLITHCKEECARRNGPGRIPTMRYIEKAAFTWEREGIFSLEAAEAYIRKLSERRGIYSEFALALGIRNRHLSATEQRYVDSWSALGFKPEAAAIAYDRTVMQTGKLSWSYMDKIMKSWHQKNLHTPQEIEAGDGWKLQGGQGKPQKATQPQTNAATSEDLNRMREALKRMRGE